MALACRTVPLSKWPHGVVVRPRPGGGPDQALVFAEDGASMSWSSAADASGSVDGAGVGARFKRIYSLTQDGEGGVWVADDGLIRRLDARSGVVTTLAGTTAPAGPWRGLAFDPANMHEVLAATSSAVWRVQTQGGGGVTLAAGSQSEKGSADGTGPAARFGSISALLPVAGGRMLIADGTDLRCMDAGGAVTTLLKCCVPQVVVVSGGDFTPAQLAGASAERLLSLLAPPASGPGGPSESGGSGSATSFASGGVVVRVGDRAFPVQRAILEAGSEYFARLLAQGGDFADSGEAEVALTEADPAAFAQLLSYMYGTSLAISGATTQLLAMPAELLRPTAELAGRLLMGGAVAALTERLAAAATPASVLSDLAWADAHGMTDLAVRLRAFAVRKRKDLDPGAVEEFAEGCPQQAAKLLKAALQA
ncbi:hypothetical protein HYH03_003934 [Edaphochlamys debaryana]|uniref:BTB domain-containing protein n=1 Tax=Edaphochlamys debaryana TaxID=47281 RepID=A0A835YAL0_9CHLO|nr:hypothetical protein HYH03_003934 [Edaphochlamys debaryana]|eukprot:KAG2498179.1 hypothetical protein HYH03_003934 [Edaphochlamys debaryana]